MCPWKALHCDFMKEFLEEQWVSLSTVPDISLTRAGVAACDHGQSESLRVSEAAIL